MSIFSFLTRAREDYDDVALIVPKAAPVALVKPVPEMGYVTSIPAGYLELASKLGFEPGQLLDIRMQNFLVEQQIPIYPEDAVEAFMIGVAEKEGANFFWRPLRKKDETNFKGWGWKRGQKHGYYQPDDSVCSPYDKLVPAHILGDVAAIEIEFGDAVCFFVSDYEADSPDPFILVASPSKQVSRYIFGCWDEPDFGVI